MRDRSLIDLQDFEVVDEPAESPETVPSAGKEDVPEPDRSIKELLDQHQEADPFQHAAKVVVKLSLPFALAWTTFIALVTSKSEDRLLDHVTERTQNVLGSYRERLRWVDDKLPGHLET